MLVGGLGLGYTVAALSALDVDAIDVVEIEQCLIDWAYQGIAPSIAAAASDPLVRLHASPPRRDRLAASRTSTVRRQMGLRRVPRREFHVMATWR